MRNPEEWEKLVREVELEQIAQRNRNPSPPPGASLPRARGNVVPNVIPAYLEKHIPKPKPKPVKLPVAYLLIPVILVLSLGVAIFWYQSATTAQMVASAVPSTPGAVIVPASGATKWDAVAGTARDSGFRRSVQQALENRLRPPGLLESMMGNQKIDWLKMSNLEAPPKGAQPLILYVVFFTLMDDATEKRWRDAGMFKREGVVATPFVRQVAITNSDTLNNLLDWHVEGVLKKYPGAK